MDPSFHQHLIDQGLARWYGGRLIPILKGGDGRDELFPAMPENFDALSDEDLASLLSQSLEAKDKIVAQDPEFLGELSATEILETMKTGVANILALKAEQASRVEAQSNLASELEALNAQVAETETLSAEGDPGDENDDPADPADADPAAAELAAVTDEPVVEEPAVETPVVEEPVVASAPPIRLRRSMPAQGRHGAVQAGPSNRGIALVASADIDGFRAGEEFDEESLALAIRASASRKTAVPAGFRDQVTVARLDLRDNDAIPDYRRLDSDDVFGNTKKINALVAAAKQGGISEEADAFALTASGGICAPVTPYYDLANVSTVERPVRDALVGFIADRGGINFAPPPVISDITDAVGIITSEQDAAGGSAGTKTCQTVICPDFEIVTVDSVFHCVTAGNLGARAYPEQIAQFNALVLAMHARVAETNLLNAIKAGSTHVTANGQAVQGDGATATLLNDILVAAAGYRSRNRMTARARLTAILPAWTADMLVGDLIASQFDRFDYNQAGVEQLLGSFNVSVSWTLDGPSDGTAQVFGAQGSGAVVTYPTDIQWALFAPGSWLFIDSGVLELGIVRDSVLNATNSYQIFGESWENAAGIGVESLWITSAVCPSGIVSNPHDPAGCD